MERILAVLNNYVIVAKSARLSALQQETVTLFCAQSFFQGLEQRLKKGLLLVGWQNTVDLISVINKERSYLMVLRNGAEI